MPKVDNKILKYNHGENPVKVPLIIYAETVSLLEKRNTCHDNPENSWTVKINGHTPSHYSLFTHCPFDATKSKLDYYRGKKCIEIFCEDLKEHAVKLRDYQKGKWYHQLIRKISIIKSEKFAAYAKYAKKDLVLIMIIKSKRPLSLYWKIQSCYSQYL